MQNKYLYIILFLISVFISSVSQIILKKSANKNYENALKEYFNVLVIIAYSLFILSSFMTIFAYRVVPLSMGPVLETSGYIWVSLLGMVFLKERIKKKKAIGLIVIIVGILIFNI